MWESGTKTSGSVDRLYAAVKEMAISFRFEPGQRVNEVAVAQHLGASRTPLREALNRLVAEGFLTYKRGRGFFCREFKPREIFELYQFRSVLEIAAVRLACEQATEAEVDELDRFLRDTGPEAGGRTSEELVALDEFFHERIMALTRNAEMTRVLANVNARIKFFRWIDMDTKRIETQREHGEILEALRDRDADLAGRRMGDHIAKRLDQITAAIKEGRSRIRLRA